jgi:maltose-binding protein MalE
MKPRSFRGNALLPGTAVVALAAVLAAAPGCGGKKARGRAPLVLWEQMDPAEHEILMENIDRWNGEHLDDVVTTTHYGTEDLRTNFQTAALAGGGPDLVYGPSDQIGPLSVLQVIQPLDGAFDPSFFAEFVPEAFDTLDGHIYAVPDQIGNHLTLVMNRKLVPETPADAEAWLATARRLTADLDGDGTTDRYGLVFELKEPFWLVPFLGGFGGWVMDSANHPTLDTPAMVDALEFVKRIKAEHVIPEDCNYQLADTLFKEGQAAMILNGPWSWAAYREAGIDVALAPIPRLPNGHWPTPMVSTKGYSVNARLQGAALDRALRLVRFLTSEESETPMVSRLGTLPSRRALYERPLVKDDPLLQASLKQVKLGRRMPVVPEMRAIWDAMRPSFQDVLNGNLTPEEAAKRMQADAVQKIREMGR